jgi:hypothetical protein
MLNHPLRPGAIKRRSTSPKGAEKNAAVLFIFPLRGKYGRRPGRGLTGAVIQIGRIAGAPAAAIR